MLYLLEQLTRIKQFIFEVVSFHEILCVYQKIEFKCLGIYITESTFRSEYSFTPLWVAYSDSLPKSPTWKERKR